MTQTPLKVIIADDEAPARNRLKDLCHDLSFINHAGVVDKINPEMGALNNGLISVIGEAKNGLEAIALVESLKPDILFLDIRMPGMDGIEAAMHIQKMATPPAIIFTTAYDNYALQAFDNNAVDYVLKPIRIERLQVAVHKARALQSNQIEAIKPLMQQKTHLSISERGRVLLVPINEVIYCRAELKYITVRTAEREYLLEESLNHLEQMLQPSFVRLHRNCLVATSFINGYEKRLINPADGADSEKQWVALLRNVPETIAVSRRQQHLIRQL